jgi:HTH-type transcriptional regulator/antitoxin HipB
MKRADSAKILAAIIKERRRDKALSQSEVGLLVGVRQATISKLENNPGSTKLETLFRVMSVLGLGIYVADKVAPEKHGEWKEAW